MRNKIITACFLAVLLVIGTLYVTAHRSEIKANQALEAVRTEQAKVKTEQALATSARTALLEQCRDGRGDACDQLYALIKQRNQSAGETNPSQVPGPQGLTGVIGVSNDPDCAHLTSSSSVSLKYDTEKRVVALVCS